MKNLFITIEGCDGAGKSTVTNHVLNHISQKGFEVIKTREPGGNPVAEKFRDIIVNHDIQPETEALAFAAARIEHIHNVVKPELEKNKFVICDRYFDSSIVYQGHARGLGVDKIININHVAIENFKPDLTIILDVDIEKAQKRIHNNNRTTNRLDNESIKFHKKCKEGFLKLQEWFPKRKIVVVDANKNEEEVKTSIIKIIDEVLNGK